MGLVQRAIEEAEIPTISVTMAPGMTRRVGVPRAASVAFPLGHPFGYPGETARQREILARLLDLARDIREPGTIADLGTGAAPAAPGRTS